MINSFEFIQQTDFTTFPNSSLNPTPLKLISPTNELFLVFSIKCRIRKLTYRLAAAVSWSHAFEGVRSGWAILILCLLWRGLRGRSRRPARGPPLNHNFSDRRRHDLEMLFCFLSTVGRGKKMDKISFTKYNEWNSFVLLPLFSVNFYFDLKPIDYNFFC